MLEAVKEGGFTLPTSARSPPPRSGTPPTYDVAVASYLGSVVAPGRHPFPGWIGATWDRRRDPPLRREPAPGRRALRDGAPGLAVAEQLHGKEMSYNNYVDADAAWRAAHDFGEPVVAIIKHANPCGIAVGADVAEAHRKAHACDPARAFGGVIAVNRPVSVALAEQVAEIFTEVIVAPAYADGASTCSPARRTSGCCGCPPHRRAAAELRPVSGGLLLQQRDRLDAPGDDPATWTLAAGDAASTPTARRPRVRLAGLPCGEVERDPAGHRRRPVGVGWARSTGSTPRGSRSRGRASGRPGRSPRPTRSSRSRTGCRF